MSRPRKKKSPRPPKAAPKKRKPASLFSYWTLMIWPVAIALLLLFQVYRTRDLRKANRERKETQALKELEEKYSAEIQELELQINLLESELKLQPEKPKS